MDDMTAFERLVAGRIQHHVGPIRPVDDAAIFTAITATRSTNRAITSLLGATKFVAAAAIVALFGGLLLMGVLTTPREQHTPAVGASASPSVEPTGGPGSFRPAGTMSEPRVRHTATLLPDGRVLVVGGSDLNGRTTVVGQAEVWDPATESFEPAGLMVEARERHTATLLDDGRVLIIGGSSDEYGLTVMESWDPATESFEHAGWLGQFDGHSATLLPDGRVLAVGGLGTLPGKAFVYDPAGPSVARMGVPANLQNRYATRLLDGRVFIIADGEGFAALIRDPATSEFEAVSRGWARRRDHAVTLLPDGRVLVIGGIAPAGKVPLASVQLWDPATESFDETGSLAAARYNHTATLLNDGRVLVVGGVYDDAFASEVWDPATSAFEPAAPLAEGRRHHTATRLPDGRVLVIGGEGDNGALATAEIWEPQVMDGGASTAP